MQAQEVEPALFFSRSLAQLCSPVFELLTGLPVFLYQQKYDLKCIQV